ncbi:MAG: hypothetical protein ACLQPV_00745 [Vulcanimicrobiaceae bacterium]
MKVRDELERRRVRRTLTAVKDKFEEALRLSLGRRGSHLQLIAGGKR